MVPSQRCSYPAASRSSRGRRESLFESALQMQQLLARVLAGAIPMAGKAARLKELFPEAADWVDAGRQDMRRQIEAHIGRVHEESGKGFRYTFPLDTGSAMSIVSALGYDASRSYFDYFIRHGRMQLPPKNGRLLAWSIENVIDFAMQLERMRYWKPGRHDQRKTFWELQRKFELHDLVYDTANDQGVRALDADQMLGAAIDANSIERRAEMASSFAVRLERADAVVEALLSQIIEEPSTSQRKALGVAVRKHVARSKAFEDVCSSHRASVQQEKHPGGGSQDAS